MRGAALYNGVSKVPDLSRSRAFQYGDGVFRTCLVHQGTVVDLGRQVRKLLADARVLGLKPPAATRVREDAERLARPHRRAVLKMVLFRAGPGRGYQPANARADRLLQVSAAPAYPPHYWARGVRVGRADVTLAAQPRLAGIKHLNRLEQVLAAAERPRGAEEILMGDDRGHPVCGSRSNLFWVRRGRLYTPSLARSGVAGQMRDRIIDLARRRRIPVSVRVASWAELAAADEMFVCNSLIGVWPVRQFGTRHWQAPGPVTAGLSRALNHPRLEST